MYISFVSCSVYLQPTSLLLRPTNCDKRAIKFFCQVEMHSKTSLTKKGGGGLFMSMRGDE